MPKEKTKSGLLNGRYILNECLFSNELGKLYHARDPHHGSGNSRGTNVLVHLFPAQAITYTESADCFGHLRTIINASPYPFLPISDYGWVDNTAYFVMAAPDSWSVKVLQSPQGSPSSLHRNAINLNHTLQKEKIVSRGLTYQAFLVTPGHLKILGTALAEQFQQMQPKMDLLPPPTTSERKSDHKIIHTLLGLGTLTGVAVAGGAYVYQQLEPIEPVISSSIIATLEQKQEKPLLLSQQDKPPTVPGSTTRVDFQTKEPEKLTPPTTDSSSTPAANSQTKEPEKLIALAATESPTTKPEKLVTVTLDPESASKLQTKKPKKLIALATEPSTTKPEKPVTVTVTVTPSPEPVSKPEKKSETRSTQKENNETGKTGVSATATTEPEPQPPKIPDQIAAVTSTEGADKTGKGTDEANTQVALTEDATEKDRVSEKKPGENTGSKNHGAKINGEKLTANGLNRKQLIEKAYAAIQKGNLSEVPGSGGIYFIRLLKRISPAHPQIKRLAREVVSAYHVKVRTALQAKKARKASRNLWMAGRIIKEFNLTKMNKAHLILKRRMAEAE